MTCCTGNQTRRQKTIRILVYLISVQAPVVGASAFLVVSGKIRRRRRSPMSVKLTTRLSLICNSTSMLYRWRCLSGLWATKTVPSKVASSNRRIWVNSQTTCLRHLMHVRSKTGICIHDRIITSQQHRGRQDMQRPRGQGTLHNV